MRAKASVQTFTSFMEGQPKVGVVVYSTLSAAVANITVAQAYCRELKTGEIRQGLITRANNGIKKRSWNIHKTLAQRCAAVVSGKGAGR